MQETINVEQTFHSRRCLRMLLWLFILIPIVEVFLLIEIGSVIGAIPTILLILLTAMIGLGMLKIQGLQTLRRFQHAAIEGQPPAMELLEGIVILVSGALLLTPGFATDAVGFLGLMRNSRQFIIRAVLRQSLGAKPNFNNKSPPSRHRNTIEGKFRRRDDD